MEETPLKRGFARTSTPRYSLRDSGYCGSEVKSSSGNHFNKLPPVCEDDFPFFSPSSLGIGELSPLKYNHANTTYHKYSFDSTQDYSINKQLNYDDSGFSSGFLSSDCESVTGVPPYNYYSEWFRPQFSSDVAPIEESSVSKSFLSNIFNLCPKVDFLELLRKKQCQHIINGLLSFLPAEDLCRMNCVSKTWKELVMKDVKANGRRREYLKKVKTQRENKVRSLSQFDIKKRYERLSQLPQIILKDINESYPDTKIESTKHCNSKFESFVTAGKCQFNGSLMKCPKCSYAARMINKNIPKYLCTDCYYVFCKNCLFPYGNGHNCSVPNNAKCIDIIGSKKCKKNLRRL